MLSTVIVFATGIALLLEGPSSRGSLLSIHKVSFLIWVVLTAIHVLGHLRGLPGAFRSRVQPGMVPELTAQTGDTGRALSLAGVVVAGIVLAILYVPQFTAWLHAHFHQH